MTDTFNYALVQNAEGNFVIQSTIKSFNLDQVTQKDIVSFYKNFFNIKPKIGILGLNPHCESIDK